ncbi:MAG: dipeptidase PepE [bacterium]|nr:dipeptidase PepE [bacterium]
MTRRRLLLLSNSKNPGQKMFEHARTTIQDFLGGRVGTIAFVPFAGVTVSWDDYAGIVDRKFGELGYKIQSVHAAANPGAFLEEADAIAVGGGNTFRLVEQLHATGIMDTIKSRADEGIPYIGWSAGSNVACPTLSTSNDMPIIQPESFRALGLVPFQINPHYLDAHPEGHGGETRQQRIEEFIELNREVFVAGLREGTMLRVEGDDISLIGNSPMRVFRHGNNPVEHEPGSDISFLLE